MRSPLRTAQPPQPARNPLRAPATAPRIALRWLPGAAPTLPNGPWRVKGKPESRTQRNEQRRTTEGTQDLQGKFAKPVVRTFFSSVTRRVSQARTHEGLAETRKCAPHCPRRREAVT